MTNGCIIFQAEDISLGIPQVKFQCREGERRKESLGANEEQLLSLFRKLNEKNQGSLIESMKELVDQQKSVELGKDNVSKLKISTRLRTILKNNGCERLRDVSRYSKMEILAFRNMGVVVYQELEDVCGRYGVEIQEYDPKNVLISELNISERMRTALYAKRCETLYDIKQLIKEEILMMRNSCLYS